VRLPTSPFRPASQASIRTRPQPWSYNDDNPNKRTMKRLILFSMVCLMTTVTQAQNETTAENDSVAWDKMLSQISVTGHRHIVRMKGNTLVAQVANSIKCKLNSYVFMQKT